MKRLLAIMLCAGGLLAGAAEPYDAALEYIESDGTQYLDTGLVLSNDGLLHAALHGRRRMVTRRAADGNRPSVARHRGDFQVISGNTKNR